MGTISSGDRIPNCILWIFRSSAEEYGNAIVVITLLLMQNYNGVFFDFF